MFEMILLSAPILSSTVVMIIKGQASNVHNNTRNIPSGLPPSLPPTPNSGLPISALKRPFTIPNRFLSVRVFRPAQRMHRPTTVFCYRTPSRTEDKDDTHVARGTLGPRKITRAWCSVAVVVAVMRLSYQFGSNTDNGEVGSRVVASAGIGIVRMAHR